MANALARNRLAGEPLYARPERAAYHEGFDHDVARIHRRGGDGPELEFLAVQAAGQKNNKAAVVAAMKPVPAPTRGEPLVIKRLPKQAPVVPDREMLAAKAAEMKAGLAGHNNRAAGAPAAHHNNNYVKPPAVVRPTAAPLDKVCAVVHAPSLVVDIFVAAEQPPAAAAPKVLSPINNMGGGGLDNCVSDLARYNMLISQAGGGGAAAQPEVKPAQRLPTWDVPTQIAAEQLFYGPSGELVTLGQYATAYNMTVDELVALYPDMAPLRNPAAAPPAAVVVPPAAVLPAAQVPPAPPIQDTAPGGGGDAEEEEEEDIAHLLALCMT